MKYTSEMLMKAMGLSVGDRVMVLEQIWTVEIDNEFDKVFLYNQYDGGLFLEKLLNNEYEILPRPKRVGDLKCGSFDGCDYGCPLCWICCHYDSKMRKDHNDDTTLYEVLQNFSFDDDQEIHDLLKARLDKEVE